MALVDFYLEDGSRLDESGFDLPTLQAATPSAPLILDLAYRWGEAPDGDRLQDLVFRLATEDPHRAGVGVMHGVPPQDQQWARARFVGQDITADPTQADFRTDWMPLGAYLGIPFPSLHVGCKRRLEIIWQAPESASGAWVFLPSVYANEHSIALPGPPVHSGILTGVGDRGKSSIVRGGGLSASDPPDDHVQIAVRQVLAAGELLGHEATSVQLDRIDGAGTPMADGEVYRVRLAATEAGVVARRGVVSLEPVAPPLEPGDIGSLGVIRVEAPLDGGPVEIGAEDIEEGPTWDRFRVEAVPDRLEVRVHPGEAIGGGTWRFWRRISDPIPLQPESVHWLWQMADGRFEVTTSTAAPSVNALGPWAEIETDSTSVTRLEDRRPLTAKSFVLAQTGTVDGPGLAALFLIPTSLQVDEILILLDQEPDGPLVFDLIEDGVSRLASSTEPQFDIGMPSLSRSAVLTVGRCHPGTSLELHVTVAPSSSVGFSNTLMGMTP